MTRCPSRLVALVAALLVAVALVAACSARTNAVAVNADRLAFTGLEAFHHRLAAVCDAQVLPAPACQRLFKTLAPAWALYLQGNRAIRQQDPGLMPAFVGAVQSVIREVRALVTDATLQHELVGHLDVAAAQE